MIRRRRRTPDGGKTAAALAAGIVVISVAAAVMRDRHERALLDGGNCTKVTEALYTPPPSAHTHCSGEGAAQSCHTSYTQADPYMRSLWRCTDPERDNRTVEFWRRTAEEIRR